MFPQVEDISIFIFLTAIFFAAIIARYLIAAGLFYWYFYNFDFDKWKLKKINRDKFPSRAQYLSEIKWSFVTSVIFAAIGVLSLILYQNGLLVLYLEPGQYGYWYLPVSLILAMVIHETYYYWVHRLMHHPGIFKKVHKVHHDSLVTSPWTAFSFHPYEGILEAVIVPLILLIIPMHILVLLIYLMIMTVSSVINHLDIQLFPTSFQHHWLFKWFIGPIHHHYHHKEFKTNYGLYFTFWDKWMNTESKRYANKKGAT